MRYGLILFLCMILTACVQRTVDYKAFQLGMASTNAEKLLPRKGGLYLFHKAGDIFFMNTVATIVDRDALTYLTFYKDRLKYVVLDVHRPHMLHGGWSAKKCNAAYAEILSELTGRYGPSTEEKKDSTHGLFREASIWGNDIMTMSATKSVRGDDCDIITVSMFAGREAEFAGWEKKFFGQIKEHQPNFDGGANDQRL